MRSLAPQAQRRAISRRSSFNGGTGGGNTTPGNPVVRFEFTIATAGEYDLDISAAGLSHTTDSMWVQIVGAAMPTRKA